FRALDDAARGGNRDVIHYNKGSESRTATAWLWRGTDSRDEARRGAQGTRIDWSIGGKLILSSREMPDILTSIIDGIAGLPSTESVKLARLQPVTGAPR